MGWIRIVMPDVQILQQENALPHAVWITRDFLDNNEVCAMDWPVYSPDLHPIENV